MSRLNSVPALRPYNQVSIFKKSNWGNMVESKRANLFVGLAIVAVSALLSGCGTESGIGLPASAAPPADGGSYGTVEDLKEAALKAGLDCPDWDLHNKAIYASSSANCSDSAGMSIYATETQMDKQLEAWKIIGEMIELERLVGKNWTIDTPDPEALQKEMGGTIFRTPGKD